MDYIALRRIELIGATYNIGDTIPYAALENANVYALLQRKDIQFAGSGGGGGGGIPDAPNDGKPYLRKSQTWNEAAAAVTPYVTQETNNPLTSTFVGAALDELTERGNATNDSLETLVNMAISHYQWFPTITIGADVYTDMYVGEDANGDPVALWRSATTTKNGVDISEDQSLVLKKHTQVTLSDTESENLPSLYSETVAAKLQEFYSLCKWLKNNMLAPISIWPRMVLAFMHTQNGETPGNVIAALNTTTGLGIEPLTQSDQNGWTVTLDNSAQGGEGAEGVLRLVYNSDTDWYVEGQAWHEGSFHNVLEYSATPPGYELVEGFDGNGGVISAISGDIANSSVAKVLNPESQFDNIDFRALVDNVAVNLMSNQTLSGIKTFLYPPQVPTPYNGADAANKAYVDAAIAAALVT